MKVTFYATFRMVVGCRDAEVPLAEGATVRDLLVEVVQRWPGLRAEVLDDEGGLARHVQVYVDGRGVRHLPNGVGTVLEPGQRVDVFPPVAGGR